MKLRSSTLPSQPRAASLCAVLAVVCCLHICACSAEAAPANAGQEWAFNTGAVSLGGPGVYNFENGAPFDALVFVSSNSVAYEVKGTGQGAGSPVWSPAYSVGSSVQARLPAALLGDNASRIRTVVFGDSNGFVHALVAPSNPPGGTPVVRWKTDIGKPVTAKIAGAFNRKVGAYTGDVLFVGTSANGSKNFMSALKATDGTRLWSTAGNDGLTNVGPIYGTPLVAYSGTGGAVYFTDFDGDVFAVDIATGLALNEYWKQPPSAAGKYSSVGVSSSHLHAVNVAGNLYEIKMDGSSNRVLPVNIGKTGIYDAPLWVPAGNCLILSSQGDMVYRVNLSGTAAVAWATPVPGPSCPIENFGSIYVGSTDGKLYELSLADGHVRATRTIGYTVGDPVVDRFNNRLFVHAGDGYLYSFSIPF